MVCKARKKIEERYRAEQTITENIRIKMNENAKQIKQKEKAVYVLREIVLMTRSATTNKTRPIKEVEREEKAKDTKSGRNTKNIQRSCDYRKL